MKYLSKHKNKLIFLITILVIGIIFGIILGIKQPNNIRENIIYGISNIKEPLINTKANNIFTHLIILLALGVLSSFFIGLFLAVIYLFYNGVVIGFNIYCLTLVYNFKGLLFSISYNIIFKLLFLLTFVFLILKYSNLTKNMIFFFLNRENIHKQYIKHNIIAIMLIISIILLNDTILYFYSTSISKILINML